MQSDNTAPENDPENTTSSSQRADGGNDEHDPAFEFMDDEDVRDDDDCERAPRYSVCSVAWAIASLGYPDGPDLLPDAWRICELVDEGTFGEWLKGMIEDPPDYESPEYAPDSIEASEAASVSAEDQMNATNTMKTLTERQQRMLQAQVDSVLPSDISFEVGQLMPFESAYDDEAESGDTSTSDDDEPHCELWDQSFPEKIRFLTKLQHDLRTKRDEALNELDFEDYSKLTNEMEGLRDKQIELLVAEIAALRSPAPAPVRIAETPITSVKETPPSFAPNSLLVGDDLGFGDDCLDEDDEPEPEYSRPLLRLGSDAQRLKDKIEHCVRIALQRLDLPAETVMRLGAMLWLVEQMPQHCEECTGTLSVSQDRGTGVASWEIRFDEEGLTFETNEIMRGDRGTDYNSREILKVTETRWSQSMGEEPQDWLDQICSYARMPDYQISVEWYPEYHMPGEGE